MGQLLTIPWFSLSRTTTAVDSTHAPHAAARLVHLDTARQRMNALLRARDPKLRGFRRHEPRPFARKAAASQDPSVAQRPPVQLGLTDTIRRTSDWLSAVLIQLERIDQHVADARAGTFAPGALLARMVRLEIGEYFFLATIRKLDGWLARTCGLDLSLETPTQ